jgi:polysaccharide export outer membrane protein
MRLKSLLIAVAALFGCLSGLPALAAPDQAAPAKPVAAAAAASSDKNYVLGSGDVIELKVLGRKDFDSQNRIAEDGGIKVPYLGAIVVKGMTAEQLGEYLSKELDKRGFYAHPIVTVDITSFASRYVTVLGEVGAPGLVPIDRPYQLSEILARVGGLKGSAADNVILTREAGEQVTIRLQDMAIGDASQDPAVSPGDKIFAPKAPVYYIAGQVKRPGAYAVEHDMTLRMAIARAGGVTDLGNEKGAKLTAKDGALRRQELDQPIKPGDSIIVGERLF